MSGRAVLPTSPDRNLGEGLEEPLTRVRRRYHFHFPGVVYAVTTVFLAIGAINSQNNLLFWAFGLAVAGMLVSGVVSGASLMGIEIARDKIPASEVGGVMRIRYRVRNNNRFLPAFSIGISERTGHPSDRDPSVAATWPGYIPEAFAFVPLVRAGETVTADAIVRPTRRGEARFRCVAAWTVFPFGLTRKSVTFVGTRVALVRPEPAESAPGPATDHAREGEAGRAAPARSLDGHEFFALREYAPGDSPRAIAWRRSARTGETIVRQNSAAANERLWVVVELGAEPDAGERLIREAAAAIHRAAARGIAVGLSVPSQEVVAPPRDGRGHVEGLLDCLAVIPSVRTRLGERVPHARGPHVRAGESAVVIRERGTTGHAGSPDHPMARAASGPSVGGGA